MFLMIIRIFPSRRGTKVNKICNEIKITDDEFYNILINRISHQNDLFVKFITQEILKGNIILCDIPQELRVHNHSFYISSLRISRNICKNLVADLELILSDINSTNNQKDKTVIMNIFIDNLQYSEINYSGDNDLNDFEKTIPKEILRKIF